MKRLRQLTARFRADESGVTSIEYGLLAGLIFSAILVSVGLLGDDIASLYVRMASKVAAVMP